MRRGLPEHDPTASAGPRGWALPARRTQAAKGRAGTPPGLASALVGISLLLPILQPTASAAPWRYEVRLSPDLARLHVRACFDAPAPTLAPGVAEGRPLLAGPPPTVGPDGCATYAVDLGAVPRGPSRAAACLRTDDAVLLSPDYWLWRPDPLPDGAEATLALDVPAGLAAAVPWPRAGSLWRLDETAFRWATASAFGRFEPDRLSVAGGVLTVAALDRPAGVTRDGLRAWLGTAARAVATLYGQLPAPAITVFTKQGPGADAVGFAMARRGGGAMVLAALGRGATDADLPGEWVAIHELLHLGMPWIHRDDGWLSEGLATFYQEVVRAWAGLRTGQQAWDELVDGFRRGRTVGTARTLSDESRHMAKTRAYWRVYWSGAAFALEADLRLRAATGGRQTLGDGLRHLRDCCARSARVWTAEQVLAALDRHAGTDLLVPLGRRYAERRDFPDTDALLAALGVTTVDGRAVVPPESLGAALMTQPPVPDPRWSRAAASLRPLTAPSPP